MITAFFVFILGLIIGSFINAQLYRTEKNISMKGRSFCPSCKHQLVWYDLVPVFSWVFLTGKCRYCKKKISWGYPAVELLTGFTFLAVGIKLGLVWDLNNYLFGSWIPGLTPGMTGASQVLATCYQLLVAILLLFSVYCFLLIALYDAKTTYVLSKFAYLGALASVALFLLDHNLALNVLTLHAFVPYLLSAIIPATLFFSLYFFSQGKWMGAGDVEIALFMGLFLGWPATLVAYYFAFIAGSIWGIFRMYVMKNATRKSELAFGPFLIAGTFFAYLFSEQIVNIYVKIFI